MLDIPLCSVKTGKTTRIWLKKRLNFLSYSYREPCYDRKTSLYSIAPCDLLMKQFSRTLLIASLAGIWICTPVLSLNAQNAPAASDKFVQAYITYNAAEEAEKNGKLEEALSQYEYVSTLLEEITLESPEWEPHVIRYRAQKTEEAIKRLSSLIPPPATTAAEPQQYTPPAQDPADAPLPEDSEFVLPHSFPPGLSPDIPSSTGPSNDILEQATREVRVRIQQLEYELNSARQEIRALREERKEYTTQLEITDLRLKETIRDLDQSRIQEAELKAKLTQAEEKLSNAVQESSEANILSQEVAKLREQLSNMALERDLAEEENDQLTLRLAQIEGEKEHATIAQQKALEELEKNRKTQEDIDKVVTENTELLAKLNDSASQIAELKKAQETNPQELAKLREEIVSLQTKLTEAESANSTYEASIAQLQAKLQETNTLLETARADVSKAAAASPEEEQKLLAENDLLRKIILREMQQQARRDQAKKLEVQSSALISQIDLLSQPVYPLSPEERALLRASDENLQPPTLPTLPPAPQETIAETNQPAPTPPEAAQEEQTTPEPPEEETRDDSTTLNLEIAAKKPVTITDAPDSDTDQNADIAADQQGVSNASPDLRDPSMPEELAALVRHAQELFQKENFKEAEGLFEQILEKDSQNIYALTSLGVIRYKTNRLKAAENTFRKAIALSPDDAFSYSILGIVYYRQGRFDDAIEVLTKAIALNPNDSVSHNYLGITASQKGWQETAEQELQTAIALNPNYADAHFNLAVVYAISSPPSKEMARQHYAKATELGASPDPTLEKLIQ